VVTGLAFAHPRVAFVLEHGRRRLLELPPVRDAAQRLADLVGPARAAKARPFRQHGGTMVVNGLLLPPTASHEVIVVVNGRLVRDRLLAGAINRALRGPSGAMEADLFLHLTLAADELDVNVHPTKAEVRFREPGAVMSVLTQALASARAAFHSPGEVRRVTVPPPATAFGQERGPYAPDPYRVPLFAATVADASPTTRTSSSAERAQPALATPFGRLIGQYRATYLLLEDEDGLLLVDQHAAHERVLYERLLATKEPQPMQRLLLPEVVELPARLAAVAEEVAQALEELGLEIEPASATTIRVLGVPAALPVAAASAMVHRLLTDLEEGSVPGATLRERAAASLACHAAIKKNWSLSLIEAERLLQDLAGLADPQRCPHGRPTMLRLAHAEIERRIGRR
jgi:DNA mismatch repair protein MutL